MKILLLLALVVFAVSFSDISNDSWQKLIKAYTISKMATADPQAHYNLAMVYAYTGYVEEGLKELGAIPKLDNSFAAKVLNRYAKKVTADKTNWEDAFYYAFALYFNNKKDDAIKMFQHVVAVAPENSIKGWAYGYIAYIYGEKKDWDSATRAITTAVSLEPNGAALYYAMGIAKKEKGDTVGAAGCLLKASSLKAVQMLGNHSISKLKNEK